jgi:uncharacterized protein (TIGR03437 family)
LPAQTVRFSISGGPTATGTIDVQLNPAAAPKTVANFLNYVSSGGYTNSIFHRAAYSNGVPFIIQGGGFQYNNNAVVTTPVNAAVTNEYSLSNVRGTIAMALSAPSGVTDINSATDEWFFNVSNNSTSLNSQQFTVFGTIVGTAGFKIMDAISVLPEYDESAILPDFSTIPLVNFTSGTPDATNYVLVTSIVVLPEPAQLGVVNAASSAAALTSGIAPGELLTIYGSNSLASLGPATGVGFDQKSNPVSTTLANTQVLFNGTPGPMLYASSGQTNVVAPFAIAGSSTVSVVVKYQNIASDPLLFRTVPAAPGIFAISGDGAIVDNTTGAVINVSNPASVGEILALFAEGQGVMTPALADGAIISGNPPYQTPVATTTLLIDGQPVPTVYYTGGAPADVNGVLQVDFAVPSLAPGKHQIQLQVVSGGTTYLSPTGVNLQTK